MADLGDSPGVAPALDCAGARFAACRTPYLFPSDLLRAERPETARDHSLSEWCPHWWLVYTKSRQEKTLSRELSALEVPHYLPTHKREAITRGRPRVVEEPLFSGYLFVYADPSQRTSALATNRIVTTSRIDDEDQLRSNLLQLAKSIAAGARLTLESKLESGDWVRVKGGIHEGLEGTVIRRRKQTRVLLAVDFLKQGASLEVHESLLEKCDPPYQRNRSSVEILRRCGR